METQWQPIDTAPKDGTNILVGLLGNESSVISARWSSSLSDWVLLEGESFDGSPNLSIDPTHWAKLPPFTNGWLPISQAPTDGTTVLVWHEHNSDPHYIASEDRLTSYGALIEGDSPSKDGPYLAFFGVGENYGESEGGWGPITVNWWVKADPELDPPQPLAPTHFQYFNTDRP